jgi:hypothetical protein
VKYLNEAFDALDRHRAICDDMKKEFAANSERLANSVVEDYVMVTLSTSGTMRRVDF